VAVVLVGGISYAVHMSAVGRRARSIADEDLHNVGMRERSLSGPFREAVSDLLYLSGQAETVAYLADPTPVNRGRLAREFVAFSRRLGTYDQIRLLDEDGMELVRVDLIAGEPVSVPDSKLQYKSDRYYIKEALACSPGVVYVSPFDLNVEGGEIEYPLQPVVRFVLLVPGSEGRSGGIVVLNLRGEELLAEFRTVRRYLGGEVTLLDSVGYWIVGPEPSPEWGFLLPGGEDDRFGDLYPSEWEKIGATAAGQFETGNGLFTYTTVYPLREVWEATCALTGTDAPPAEGSPASGWEIVSRLPPRDRARGRDQLRGGDCGEHRFGEHDGLHCYRRQRKRRLSPPRDR